MIVYYITSHGFGHTVRSCEIVRHLPAEMPLTLRTVVPEWFLRRELGERPFTLAPAAFDCGVLGPDSARIDLALTVTRAEALQAQNEARRAEEVAFLKGCGARLVVCDVPAFPLRVAREAGVPSILVANFTWAGIYRHLEAFFCDDEALRVRTDALIAQMQLDYAQGDLLLATDMAIPIEACRKRADVPLVARRGTPRRAELVRALGLDPARPIFLIYLGRDGIEGLEWERREHLRGFSFISFSPPARTDGFIHRVPEDLISHGDAVASVDGVVAKPGYGICGECVAGGVPLIYPPRPEFAEMRAVEALMARWGGGVAIEEEDFRTLNWRPSLDRLTAFRLEPEMIDCRGGQVCAEYLREHYR